MRIEIIPPIRPIQPIARPAMPQDREPPPRPLPRFAGPWLEVPGQERGRILDIRV